MALKDKLMTLEDFKAVRDVDVASNSAQFTEIKADLDAQADDINESLENIEEEVRKGNVRGILPILSMFYDKLMTKDAYGPDYYRFIQQTFGVEEKTVKVFVGYGISKLQNLNAYIISARENRMITEPIFIDSLKPITLKVIGLKAASLRVGIKYNYSEVVTSAASSVHFPNYGRNPTDSIFGFEDITYTMVDGNNNLDVRPSSPQVNGLPKNVLFKSIRLMFTDAEDMSNPLPVDAFEGKIIVNGIPYSMDFQTSLPTSKIKVYKGMSINSSDGGYPVDSENRAVTDYLPFVGDGTTVSFSGSVTNNLQFVLRYFYRLNNEVLCAAANWNGESGLWTFGTGTKTAKITLEQGAVLLGYCVIIFKDKDSEIPINTVSGAITINGSSYSVEEVEHNDIV